MTYQVPGIWRRQHYHLSTYQVPGLSIFLVDVDGSFHELVEASVEVVEASMGLKKLPQK